MHKIYPLLFSVLLTYSYNAQANAPVDSIGVENHKGKKVILHQVDPKETYYSISKRYNIPYKEVMEFNDSRFLQIGVILKIPTQLQFVATTPTASSSKSDVSEYTIKAKDNLNMIAEKYGTTVAEIKKINQLSSNNLRIGQVLIIPTSATSETQTPTNTTAQIAPEVAAINPSVATKTFDYTIKPKESLNVLAERFGTTIEEIKRINGFTSSNLRVGQVVKIPANGNTETQVATTAQEPLKSTSTIPETVNTIDYKIKPRENLNVLAERFGTTVEEIKRINGFTSNNLQIGQVVKVPSSNGTSTTIPENSPLVNQKLPEEVVKNLKTPKATASTNNGFEHTVVAGETIYSIGSKYGLTTYQIKLANNLTSSEVVVGQKLIIKGANVVAEEEENSSAPNTIKDPSLRYAPSKYGITQIEEKGQAVWIADPDLDASKMLILHRTAPVGTIIKITYPMSNRSTFAKVVGKFTENETTKDVIIVMTKAVADAVGALDKRFFCNITYGAQENEQ